MKGTSNKMNSGLRDGMNARILTMNCLFSSCHQLIHIIIIYHCSKRFTFSLQIAAIGKFF